MSFEFRSSPAPAPKEVSASDRAMIDAAIAAGMVRKIPRGVSGLPELRWSERERCLRYVVTASGWRGRPAATTETPEARSRRTAAIVAANAERVAAAAVRNAAIDAEVAERVARGEQSADIMAAMGLTKSGFWRSRSRIKASRAEAEQ